MTVHRSRRPLPGACRQDDRALRRACLGSRPEPILRTCTRRRQVQPPCTIASPARESGASSRRIADFVRLNLRREADRCPAMTSVSQSKPRRSTSPSIPTRPGSADRAAVAVIESGLRCRVEDPEGAVIFTDMPVAVGGGNTAPTPGWRGQLTRAATHCGRTVPALSFSLNSPRTVLPWSSFRTILLVTARCWQKGAPACWSASHRCPIPRPRGVRHTLTSLLLTAVAAVLRRGRRCPGGRAAAGARRR